MVDAGALSFDRFQELNVERARQAFPDRCLTLEFLALAIAGEAGELANIVKKFLRGDFDPLHEADARDDLVRQDLLKEAADVITYCDLLISHLGGRTSTAVAEKWNEVSVRRQYPERLPVPVSDGVVGRGTL